MAILFDQIVFGPVHSRRLGNSLGVNLLPLDHKICNFNCIYCECGWTDLKKKSVQFIDAKVITAAAEQEFKLLAERHVNIDNITFAGNGEPTMHPHFSEIIHTISILRDKYFPGILITLLSNGALIGKKKVINGIQYADKLIFKLDAGTDEMFNNIDMPLGRRKLKDYVRQLKKLNKSITIQTLFLKGDYNKMSIDNTQPGEVEKWLELLQEISPAEVQIYTLDRKSPTKALIKISEQELKYISSKVEQKGIQSKVYY